MNGGVGGAKVGLTDRRLVIKSWTCMAKFQLLDLSRLMMCGVVLEKNIMFFMVDTLTWSYANYVT